MHTRIACLTFLLTALLAPHASAQAADPPPDDGFAAEPALSEVEGPLLELPFDIAGPPPPSPPATLTRDADGRVTARAVRLAQPLRVDGRLDEAIYYSIRPMSGFIQNEPRPGADATERTEVWVSFDADHVYVSVRAWESQPERMIVNEMRRDSMNIAANESVAFAFDTFYDRRNSVVFNVNPLGGRMDGQNVNEGQYNGDWNPVWDLAVGRFEGGWTVEAAIPFKSLRYRPGVAQIWGFNVRRRNRWKNEISYLSRVADGAGLTGINRMSQAATLVGIEAPPASRTLDLKPYIVSDVTTDLGATPHVRHAVGADVGLDAKYALTQNLAADFTYNTDFAQVEADEQQVNLTRFNLFFPEKREFFLENQGLFNFGGAGGFGGGNDVPILFYSRRIGLDRGITSPLEAGGRLTGRVGAYSVGLINIQTGDQPSVALSGANFTVARVRRDILRRSAVGAIVTRRSQASDGAGGNDVFGLDGRFAFFENLAINTYWARTRTPGRRGDDTSYRFHVQYNGDRYGATLHHLRVGDHFNPDVGFVRRDDLRRHYAQLRFSPRPTRIRSVRKFTYQASMTYLENGAGAIETRERTVEFQTEFQSGDALEVTFEDGFDAFDAPFRIATGVTIPAGGYDLRTLRAAWTFGQQWRASGTWFVERGAFYDGDRTTVGYSRGRINLTPQLAVEPGFTVNRVELPFGEFTTTLASARTTFTITPLTFVSALVQYNSSNSSFSTNLRLRWEYLPGSELFVVYNEGRDTQARGLPALQNRALVFKVNRLLRF